MFTGQTTIEKVTARCPARTEALMARLRLKHLFQTADIAPHGFPPQAILVIRRAASPQNISLATLHLRPEWEREMRESVARLWRRAARPVRGHVPAEAEAVLFQDVGEWLASLGVAVERRSIERHWCWQASLGANLAVSSPQTLMRAWVQAPRFVPAAIVHLARWGQAARVLQMLRPAEAATLLAALCAEFDLPRFITSRDVSALLRGPLAQTSDVPEAAAASGSTRPSTEGTRAAPWKRWFPTAENVCERLTPPAQCLLAMSIAVFHSPALARNSHFAAEVLAWTERPPATQGRVATAKPTSTPRTPLVPHTQEAHATDTRPTDVSDTSESRAGELANEGAAIDTGGIAVEVDEGSGAETDLSPWANLDGCETALGGVLFLVNLFAHLRLPECFDDDFRLSEHIGGWGLAEVLGSALLGDLHGQYEDDPVWRMLAQLDGRAMGEPPAACLQVGGRFRLPADWLKRFVPAGMVWEVSASVARLVLWHGAGNFPIVVRPRKGMAINRFAAEEADYYRVQGVVAQLRGGVTPRPAWPDGSFAARPPPPRPLRRWMSWTFPFLKYVLVRALTDECAPTDEELAHTLLVKRGRLFCTDTHVDLVMGMNQVSLPVRRAGLDATPGWMRDLLRVVSFHYE